MRDFDPLTCVCLVCHWAVGSLPSLAYEATLEVTTCFIDNSLATGLPYTYALVYEQRRLKLGPDIKFDCTSYSVGAIHCRFIGLILVLNVRVI